MDMHMINIFIYTCVHVYIYTCTHVTYTHIHIYTYTHIHICTYTHIHTESSDASDGSALGQGSVFQHLDHDPLLQFTHASSVSEASAAAGARGSLITVCRYHRVRVQIAVADRRSATGGERARGAQCPVRAMLLMLEEPLDDDGAEPCMAAARAQDSAPCGNDASASSGPAAASSGPAATSRACSSLPSPFPSAATSLSQDAGRARSVERGCGAVDTVAGVEEMLELMRRVNGIYTLDSSNSTTTPGAMRTAWGGELVSHWLGEEMSFVKRLAGRVTSWCVSSITTALWRHVQGTHSHKSALYNWYQSDTHSQKFSIQGRSMVSPRPVGRDG